MKTSRKFVAAPTTRGGRLLVLGIFGLCAIVAGCAEKEGVIELKTPAAAPAPGGDAPRKGPKRGPDRVPEKKPAA